MWLRATGAYLVAAGIVVLAQMLFRRWGGTWENSLNEFALAIGLGLWTAFLVLVAHHYFGKEVDPVGVAVVVSLLFLVRTPKGKEGMGGDND